MKSTTIILTALAILFASCQKDEEFNCVKCRTTWPYMYGAYNYSVVDTVFCGKSTAFIDQYIKDNTTTIKYRPYDTGDYYYRITTECH